MAIRRTTKKYEVDFYPKIFSPRVNIVGAICQRCRGGKGVLNMCSIIIIGGRPTCPTTPGYVCGARSQSAAAAAEPLGGEKDKDGRDTRGLAMAIPKKRFFAFEAGGEEDQPFSSLILPLLLLAASRNLLSESSCRMMDSFSRASLHLTQPTAFAIQFTVFYE